MKSKKKKMNIETVCAVCGNPIPRPWKGKALRCKWCGHDNIREGDRIIEKYKDSMV